MGHASAIALGALEVCNNRRIILLDGDGIACIWEF